MCFYTVSGTYFPSLYSLSILLLNAVLTSVYIESFAKGFI